MPAIVRQQPHIAYRSQMQAIGSLQPHRIRDQVERKEQKACGAPRTQNKINMAQLRRQSRARSQEVQPLIAVKRRSQEQRGAVRSCSDERQ
ncbi:hypothetical protein HaLaN_12101 [Haematococcus lacustris]|uniref:Uncharacterized protein n=1 Tax=Haematococcus lacustris TaxID=44745 RepID=A0A699Z1A0_HAELA|nr:hypothetical protein HaLaN_12101 [Haematococcus lacustris]